MTIITITTPTGKVSTHTKWSEALRCFDLDYNKKESAKSAKELLKRNNYTVDVRIINAPKED